MAASGGEISTDVLIVGAGPSGLMLAVCLAKLGVDALIIDGKLGPTRESRALAVQARSMELYDQLGLVDRVLAERSPATVVVPGTPDRVFGRLELRAISTGLTPYGEVTVFEQSANERLLADTLDRAGRPARWGWELTELEVVDAGAVTATVTTPSGPATIHARYCVGADGAHSRVRQHLGIAFEGITNVHTFYLVDATGVTGLTDGAVNMRVTADHYLLSFPMGTSASGRSRMRLLGVVHDRDRDPNGELPEPRVRAFLAREFGVGYDDADWFTTYRLHHRLAARFRVGPCFLVGDAAHIHSPVGAQGMNTGLQEAHNLACALADVLLGGMPDSRLDRYEAERRPVGKILVSTTDRAFALVTSRSPLARFIRGRIVPLIGPIAVRVLPRLFGGKRVFGYLSQIRIRYRLPDASGDRRSRVLGRRLPWTGDNYAPLRAFEWQLHGYGVPATAVTRIAGELGVAGHAFPRDAQGRLLRDRVYLIRRDGFVVAEIRSPGQGADLDGARAMLRGA
ncbi:MAG TPA: FAD-dependent monooxygenase [Candidatus Lumbricidophila sp.]|nr:FAD-dependent monooxygenase [Candidatus Lumbricidophila sp.]